MRWTRPRSSLLVIGATAVGAVLYLTAERIREWQLHVAVGVGTVMVSLANLAVGHVAALPAAVLVDGPLLLLLLPDAGGADAARLHRA